ncbi:HNH endonuclease signature motif containing protein [Cryobacterium sp. PAMC25264]|uniref:HNH endonuclease signature motif containing protein n=1 Tax=Cryobacterium sp. PAMC25264 TaxID=2861288 RepID=UPI001C627A5C|nr:HNH endonuclease signature motif containing protein [Cryobacterium sp. PAMC25264]QYF73398.1 HNH endonuclease [Cryobacterium sp. PAMC25264]
MSTIADTFVVGTSPEALVPAVPTADTGADSLVAAAGAVTRFGACSADFDALPDAELLAAQREITRLQALTSTRSVWVAKAVAHRSRPELGQSGLASQQGFLNPGDLMQNLTGASKADARKLADVGRMLADSDAAEAAAARAQADADAQIEADADADSGDGGDASPALAPLGIPALPWHTPIAHAVTDGSLSAAQAHAIRTGLGDIDTVVTADILADNLATLLEEARTLTIDQLIRRARRMRDRLDEAGISKREQKAWDDRYLRIWTLETGQVRINGVFPPEQGEYIRSVSDSLTGPRRGGVHFVDPDRAAWAKAVQDDPRSVDQLTADGFIDLIRAGSAVNPRRMLGGRTPAVRILKTQRPTGPAASGSAPEQSRQVGESTTGDATPGRGLPPEPADVLVPLPDGTGHGYIEGNPAPVSQATVDRLICDSGTLEITFDPSGQPLDVGREERLFTMAQRIALAARDGGCMWGDCAKPPSQTEAHHIDHWKRDDGRTDIRVGILLCNPHHRLLHNQGWQILDHQGRYWLRPPVTVDPGQRLIDLHSKSPAALDQQERGEH